MEHCRQVGLVISGVKGGWSEGSGPRSKREVSSKLHRCPYCPYVTNKSTNITTHLCVHTGEKPYACPHCPRQFAQKGNLQSHVYTHTGEKPFACTFCPYRSTQKSNLKSHILTHHAQNESSPSQSPNYSGQAQVFLDSTKLA